MSSKCQQIIQLIEDIAPKNLAEEWDNVGLQIGSPGMDVKKALVCLDVNMLVLKEAIQYEVDLIISHHPLIFTPLKNIRWDHYKGDMIKTLLMNTIGVYCAHTNIDISNKGLNTWLAHKLKLKKIQVLNQLFTERMYKFVVYVPESKIEVLKKTLGDLGAGWIGNYSHCTFTTNGIGTFQPMNGANPYIGTIGQIDQVHECRIETIVKEKDLSRIIKRILKIHPYEEVAYDVYPLENSGETHGLGVLGERDPIATNLFIEDIKSTLDISVVRIAGKKPDAIGKVALCTGAGANLIKKAKYAGAQVLVTGDIKYHDAQLADELGIFIIDAGHFATEKIFIDGISSYLKDETIARKMKVEIIPSYANRDYIQFV
ncbi:MAG: Nif3-like dinuclear metal center hexameric protein [Eubacteriales bacterium]